MFWRAIGVAVLCVLLSACASYEPVVSYERQVTISTMPTWASFRVVGDPTIYFTPSTIGVTYSHSCAVRIEKDGYEPVLLKIYRLGVGEGGRAGGHSEVPGWAVEPLSEVQYRIVGDTLMITLKSTAPPEPPPSPAPPPGLMIEPEKDEVSEKLQELYRLRKQGKISASRYKAMKKKILEDGQAPSKETKPARISP